MMSFLIKVLNQLRFVIFISIISIIFFSCGGCPEPDDEQVKADFESNCTNCELVSIKNIETSPPCFYWEVKHKIETDSIITSTYKYCCSDIFDSNQTLEIFK